jgi:hypothetical protein
VVRVVSDCSEFDDISKGNHICRDYASLLGLNEEVCSTGDYTTARAFSFEHRNGFSE